MSIFIIIALGCGFFTGLKATCPDMILTASRYFESNRLMDLRLRSNIGVRSSEIAAVRSAEGVSGACAGYSKDLYYTYGDQNLVLKAISLNSNASGSEKNDLNLPEVIEGRLPREKNECVVEKKMSSPDTFEVGNSITLLSPSADEDISETLACDTFEIVGIVTSPLYIGFERDASTVGSGSVNSNIFLPEEAFVCDYYTNLYVKLEGMEDLDPFSEEYERETLKRGAVAEEAFQESVRARYDELISEAKRKIDSAQNEADTLRLALSCGDEELRSLYDQAKKSAELLRESYESSDGLTGARKYLLLSQVTKAEQTAETLGGLIEDTDGSLRAELEEKLTSAEKEIEAAKDQADSAAELKFYSDTRFSSSDYSSYKDDAEKIDNVSKAFPMFFILIAALVCLTAMTRMVEEQRTVIGAYKALGYSSRHILIKYMIYGSAASLAGSCIGSAIGLQVFPRIIINTYKIMYNIPGALTPFRAGYTIAAAAASLLLIGSAVVYACARELKGQPADIIRPKPPVNGRRVLPERIPALWNRLSFLMKVTVRNLLRYKKRFFMTLVGVSGCTALIITGFGLKHSITAIIDRQFGEIYKYSAVAALNTDEDDPTDALGECGYVKQSMPACSFNVRAGANGEDYSATVMATDATPSDFIEMKSPDGEEISLGKGVAVTQKLAQMCSLEVGDEIEITDSAGDEYKAEISGIMRNYALNYIYMTRSEYERIFGEEPEYNIAMITVDEGADEDEVKRELISDDRILGVSFKSDSTRGFMRSIESMNAIVALLIICAAFLAVTVLYNLANINITERRRELATIKVLGFYDLETSAYIYRENIISTVIGILFGMLLGRLLHYFVVITVEVEAVLFIRELVPSAYLLGAALTALFAALVNAALHFKLKKIDMAESLKSIE